MKIGIIGAGNIGGTLTRRFRATGHEVAVANSKNPESLGDLADETGAQAVTVEEAIRGKDVVIVAIPFNRIKDLPPNLFASAPENMVVIDGNNYYPRERDGRVAEIEAGLPESRWVERQLGHPVVKVFNNIIAEHLLASGKPKGAVGRIALPIAGDAAAKEIVMNLVNDIGFDTVDNGTLDESWRQQPGSPVYLSNYDAEGVRRALKEASKERPAKFTATPNSPGTYESPA